MEATGPLLTVESLKASLRNTDVIPTCGVPQNADPWGRKHIHYDMAANKCLVNVKPQLITPISSLIINPDEFPFYVMFSLPMPQSLACFPFFTVD